MKRRVILVTGMHRSGTSMMAHLLSDAGVPFGNNLLDHTVPDNHEGYGEHALLWKLHEDLLDSFDRTWHGEKGTLPLPPAWLEWPETVRARSVIRDIVRDETSSTGVWAIKDPRLSRLLPLWLDVLSEMSIEVSVVVCFRNPRSVASSLGVRNTMPSPQALGIWQIHYDDLFASIEKAEVSNGVRLSKVVYADYDRIVDFPEEQTRRILFFLLGKVTRDRLARATARSKISLRHQKHEEGASSYADLSHVTRETFSTLKDRALSQEGANLGVRKRLAGLSIFPPGPFRGKLLLIRRALRNILP